MARIKIKDLPKDKKISKEEMERVKGGFFNINTSYGIFPVEGESQDKDHKNWID